MRVNLFAFPAVYLNATCKRHNTLVTVKVEVSSPFQSNSVSGAQLTALSCHIGGPVASADCTSEWVITASAGGDITITT